MNANIYEALENEIMAIYDKAEKDLGGNEYQQEYACGVQYACDNALDRLDLIKDDESIEALKLFKTQMGKLEDNNYNTWVRQDDNYFAGAACETYEKIQIMVGKYIDNK